MDRSEILNKMAYLEELLQEESCPRFPHWLSNILSILGGVVFLFLFFIINFAIALFFLESASESFSETFSFFLSFLSLGIAFVFWSGMLSVYHRYDPAHKKYREKQSLLSLKRKNYIKKDLDKLKESLDNKDSCLS